MDITDIISEEYVEFSPETPVSKLAGTFEDPAVRGVVVHGDEFEGVVTRRRSRRRTTRPTRSSGRWSGTSPGWTPGEDVRKIGAAHDRQRLATPARLRGP